MQGFVYLIFSHGNAVQLIRLAQAIRNLSPESAIVFHHDAASPALNEAQFSHIDNVYLIPNPVSVKWGHISFVDAFILSSRYILDNMNMDWLVTISGMDYPIQPLSQFEHRLSSSGFDAAFRYFEACGGHSGWPAGEGEKRYYYQYYEIPEFPYYYRVPAGIKKRLSNLIDKLNRSHLPMRFRVRYRNLPTALGLRARSRPFTENFRCYGGWDWFNLNRKSLDEIHRFLDGNPGFKTYYERTILPSESLVHTILLNNRDIKVNNEAYRYIKWVGNASTSPGTIDIKDFDLLVRSGYPFARKFDLNLDDGIFDEVDALTSKSR